jgi:metal-sulfur cluster biosynthetic enzyme
VSDAGHTAWTPGGETAARPTEDRIIAAICDVFDPEIPVNIYELGLIYAVEINDENAVKVEMTLTAPACPSAQELPQQVRDAVMTVPGVASEPDERRSPFAVEHVLSRVTP